MRAWLLAYRMSALWNGGVLAHARIVSAFPFSSIEDSEYETVHMLL